MHEDLPRSRKEARELGVQHYFTGHPCGRDHVSPRYASNGVCVACSSEYNNTEARRHSTRAHSANRHGYKPPDKPTRPMPDNCECCDRPASEERHERLQLDHCHDTGAFRGWLCDRCNRGVGCLGDNLGGVLRMVRYLERHDPEIGG